MKLDGVDLSSLLLNQKKKIENRLVFIHNRQDWRPPMDVNQTCIFKYDWRLIKGKALYNIRKDPKQKYNVAHQYPELVKELLAQNAVFLKETKRNSEYKELPTQHIGNSKQEEIKLTIQHAIGEDSGIWKCE